jgi:hypothetical protein
MIRYRGGLNKWFPGSEKPLASYAFGEEQRGYLAVHFLVAAGDLFVLVLATGLAAGLLLKRYIR